MSAPQPYVYATTEDQARRWLAEIGTPRFVAVDTETAGWDPYEHALLLVQVSAGPEHPVLVLDARAVDARVLQPLLEDAGVLKVFHHGAFDLRFLAVAGIRVRRVADTMLAQQLLDGGEKTDAGVGLAGIADFRLGMRLDKQVRETFSDASLITDAQLRYAADDAVATWAIFDEQRRELEGHGLVRVAQIEFGALPALAELQLRGVAFDAPRWQALLGALEAELPEISDRVQVLLETEESPRNLFGVEPVNLDSPEQVKEALARVGVEIESTREYVLRDFADHPAVAALLEYRQVSKITSNWGGDWAGRVVHGRTGRIHADWRQIVGAGRIACSDPNLTQVPKESRYRACFGGQPERAMVVADYSQQELRILAAVSGDGALTEVFRRGGDLHRATAAMVFDLEEDAVSAPQRAAAKALNFGLMYGMGAPGFARATKRTVPEAQEIMQRYFAAFPRVAAWLEQAESSAKRTGKARTALGRIRSLAGLTSTATLARNAPIQGAGADMTKLAIAAVARRLGELCPGPLPVAPDGLVLTVHDELVVEVDAARADEAAKAVEEGMLEAAEEVLGDVPAAVDVAVRPRWGA